MLQFIRFLLARCSLPFASGIIKKTETVTSDVSAKGESECEATSLDFVILDYYIIFKLNLNIENVLEKQEISKNKQSRHTQNRFPLFLKSLSGWKWQ